MGITTDRDTNTLVFNPPSPGCVLFLPGLPGGGSKLHDRSPYGTPGTITGATWEFNGRVWYLNFDGIDDYVNCGTPPALDLERTDQFSVFAWVKRLSLTAATRIILSKALASGTYRGWAFWVSSGHYVTVILKNTDVPNNAIHINTEATVLDTNWHLIGFTYNGSSSAAGVKIYIDSLLQATTVFQDSLTATIKTTQDVNVGARANGSNPWSGSIGPVLVLKGVILSQLQIQGYFEQTKRLFGRV